MKVWIVGFAALAAGVALAKCGRFGPADHAASAVAEESSGQSGAASQPSLERRVADLERALAVEREARQMLEDELFLMLRNLPASGDADETAPRSDRALAPARRAAARGGDYQKDYRVSALVEAGIEPARAEWILRRESELQFEDLQMRYEAGRSGGLAEFYTTRVDFGNRLREELGDADYERYLQASGRPGSVVVSAVLEASPAQAAGLRPGDRITRYDGQRVFTMIDVTRGIMNGRPGESVVLEFERDGQPMQVVLPRGPVGISGGS